MQHPKYPLYMKLTRSLFESLGGLPKQQRAKALYAFVELFFDGTEPGRGELPKNARPYYEANRGWLLSLRRNVVNGSHNSPSFKRETTHVSDGKAEETDSKTMQVSEAESETETECQQVPSPAISSEVGTYPTADPSTTLGYGLGAGLGATNNKEEIERKKKEEEKPYQRPDVDEYGNPLDRDTLLHLISESTEGH